ncbi:MAG: hypothetical protein EOP04_04500 [Proteobacteria bacterium]|nr:MAG: hypothetical protein EOP04_04500 [Pseudomonadota bacterium]
MDSTEKMLEGMDGTAFEKLCGPLLQKMIPELANLLPSGINAEGRTIKSLSDGFCFVSRYHYATMHATTNASNLKKKWLYNGTSRTTPKGDLIKSIEQARSMHHENPNYTFSIYLVSSRRVDDELHIEVNQSVSEDYITVKIVEQRHLASFLDHDRDGQYFRQYFLGINAVRISAPLLREIANVNLARYGVDISLNQNHLANLSNQKKVEERISTSTTTVNLIIGDSGLGKSTLCYAMINTVLKAGRMGLRLKPSMIEKAVSFEDAILQQVKIDHPGLYVDTKDIEEFFVDAFVVVDDINKSENTTPLLDKLISWNRTKRTGSITVLCPVWPRNLATLDDKGRKEHMFTVVPLRRATFYDCKAIVQQRIDNEHVNLTEQQTHSLIVETGFDPLLLDLSLLRLSDSQPYTENLASEAIKSYVSDKVQQVHKTHLSPVHSINQSLVALGKQMLQHRNLNPHIQDIESWMGQGSEEYRIIVQIAAQRQLLSFDDEGNSFFRHDRVRDYLLTLAAVDLFKDFHANQNVLTDPYYSEITGAAIAAVTPNNEILEALIQSNPLAVYVSLKYLQEAASQAKQATIVTVIKEWNTSVSMTHVPKTIFIAIANALIGFDVKNIQTITQGFPDSAELQLARFRNGIWLAGVNFLSLINYFYPEAPTYWWNSILGHVQGTYLEPTVEGLCSFLPERFTADGIAHAYTLAGFLREPQLMEALAVSWRKYASPTNYVPYLWAVLNSFTKNDRQIVFDALAYWSSMSAEGKAHRVDNRLAARTISDELKVLNWDFSEEQLALLIELSAEDSLQEILAFLFTKTDHPTALALVLNNEMQRDADDHRHDRSDSRWDRSKNKHPLSQPSLDYLLQVFSDPSANHLKRYLAWRYWTGNVAANIALPKMQEIVSEQDSLFNNAVLWRVKQRDYTAFPPLRQCIAHKPWLVRVLDYIWSDEVGMFFEDWFAQRLNDESELDWGLELLSLLDNDDACRILVKHWEQLKWHRRAIGTALFLSVPATKALADNEIRRLGFHPEQAMPNYYTGNLDGLYISEGDGLSQEKKAKLLLLSEQFKYLYMYYGNKYEGRGERLTKEKLESLLPYLALFDELSIYEFAQDSLRIGAPDLCYERFYPLLKSHLKKRFRLTVDDLKHDLIEKHRELERDNKVHIDHWLEEAEKLNVTSEMMTQAIKSFFKKHQDANALFLACIVLKRFGTRKDIPILENFLCRLDSQVMNAEYWITDVLFDIKRRSLH